MLLIKLNRTTFIARRTKLPFVLTDHARVTLHWSTSYLWRLKTLTLRTVSMVDSSMKSARTRCGARLRHRRPIHVAANTPNVIPLSAGTAPKLVVARKPTIRGH